MLGSDYFGDIYQYLAKYFSQIWDQLHLKNTHACQASSMYHPFLVMPVFGN